MKCYFFSKKVCVDFFRVIKVGALSKKVLQAETYSYWDLHIELDFLKLLSYCIREESTRLLLISY